MDKISEIEDMLENLAEDIEPHLPLIPKFLSSLDSTDKPLSIFSMTSFFPKVESIRAGIFEVAKIEEYYSVSILYRSLIEHFIKAQYMWMKTNSNSDDSVGIDYWLFGQDKENIDYAKALEHGYSLIGMSPKIPSLQALHEMGIVSKDKSANKIRKKTEQFNYKNMVHYLADSLKTKESGAAPILSSIFPRYSQLSSFVHGGPDSVNAYEKSPEELQEIIEMATFASLYTRWCAFILFYQYDKSVEPLCQIAQGYLHKYTGHNKSSNLTGEKDSPSS